MRADSLKWEGHLRILEEIYYVAMQLMADSEGSHSPSGEFSAHEKYASLWSEYTEMVMKSDQLPPVSIQMEEKISEQLNRIKQILVPLRKSLETEKSNIAAAMNRVGGQRSVYSHHNQLSSRLNAIL